MGCSASGAKSTGRAPGGEECFHQKYKVGSKLGEGNFGEVRVATLQSSKEVRAVKIIDLTGVDKKKTCDVDKRRVRGALAEAEVMRRLKGHEHCVQFFEAFTAQATFYLVMERCDSTLVDCLDRMKCASEDYVSHLFRDMLVGVVHVHRVNLVHCDIKPNNFLLGGSDGKTVKLSDFGMTCELPKRGYLTSHCGTAPYMSPEIVAHKPYDFKTDVWSMGVTAYVLLYGDFPYVPETCTPQAMKEQILLGEPTPDFMPASPRACSPSACAKLFVCTLMARDQVQRCTAQEALQLDFVCPGIEPPPDAAHDLTPSFRRARLKACAKDSNAMVPEGPDTHSRTAFWLHSETDSTRSTATSSALGASGSPPASECTHSTAETVFKMVF